MIFLMGMGYKFILLHRTTMFKLLTAVSQMAVLTVTEQTPPSLQGEGETQTSKTMIMSTVVRSAAHIHFVAVYCLPAGLSPPSSTFSDCTSPPPPSLEPAIVQRVTYSHLLPQAHSGNVVAMCIDLLG